MIIRLDVSSICGFTSSTIDITRTNFPPKFIQFCNIVQIGEAQSDSGAAAGLAGREGELNGAPGDLAKSLRARVCLAGWSQSCHLAGVVDARELIATRVG